MGQLIVAAAFDRIVEKLGLRFISLFNGRKSALGFDPIEDQAHHVHGESGRRVVKRALFYVRAILEDFGDLFVRAFGEIAAQDHHGCAGGPEIFLRAGKDQPKLPDFDRPRANIRRHVRHKRNSASFGNFVPFRAVYGVIRAHENVGSIRCECDFVCSRHAHKFRGLGGSGEAIGGELFQLLDCLAGPRAGVQHVHGLCRGDIGSSAPWRTASCRRPAGTSTA